ncbi:quorum-sensing autoinducer CAI-1 synthase [Luteibacter sp. PPL552]
MAHAASQGQRIVRSPALPDFVARRVVRFHDERVAIDWGGRHILRGRRPSSDALMLQSNDYLAIAGHPAIIEAQRESLGRGGLGMMMSALFQQDADEPLHRVERELARAVGSEDGILAQSGFAANVGLIQSIAEERVPVYVDMLAHASLWEGIRSARATAVSVLHNDVTHLERQLLRHGPGVIVVDSVYSTQGSVAPLERIADLSEAHGCVLVVDESHSLGTHGEHGEGLVASLGLNDRVHFITASLAKAYCSRAGFIACTTRFKDYFGCEALPAIFSSSLLPHDMAGLLAAHGVIRNETWRRERLRAVTRHVRGELTALGYPIGEGTEQIIAFEAGQERLTAHVRDVLERHGIFGSVFSAPATTVNRSLLRLTLNAGMGDHDVERLIAVCHDAREDMNLSAWSASRRAQRDGERVLAVSAA